jgi:release factor glutamine methyltransferase
MQGLANNQLHEVRRWVVGRLERFGARESMSLARILFEDLLDIDNQRHLAHPEQVLSESDILKLHSAIIKLEKSIPVQYVVGKALFADLELEVNEHVLIPRPETEELVQLVTEHVAGKESSILDIGTGSGCIALAIKSKERACQVSACDVSKSALETAERNGKRNGLSVNFFEINYLEKFPEKSYDVLVSNPPYIETRELKSMSPTVVDFEPHLALFVEDGSPLIFYKRILESCGKTLNTGGAVFLECHEDHAQKVQHLFLDSGHFQSVQTISDLQGKQRFVVAHGFLFKS